MMDTASETEKFTIRILWWNHRKKFSFNCVTSVKFVLNLIRISNVLKHHRKYLNTELNGFEFSWTFTSNCYFKIIAIHQLIHKFFAESKQVKWWILLFSCKYFFVLGRIIDQTSNQKYKFKIKTDVVNMLLMWLKCVEQDTTILKVWVTSK